MATASLPVPETKTKRPGFVGSLLRFAIIAWVLRCLLLEPFFIPSGSMQPTMAIGDYLFVEKWSYGYSRYSFLWQFPPIGGRVLGSLPERGDVVAVDNGVVILNGTPVERVRVADAAIRVSANSPCRTIGMAPQVETVGHGAALCKYPAYLEKLPSGKKFVTLDQSDTPADHFGPVTVPAGTVFMMGDNRDDSEDSRFSPSIGGAGYVPVDHLVGKAGFIFWSTDGSASWIRPWTWFSALRSDRIGHGY